MPDKIINPHPGEILKEDFLEPLQLTQKALSEKSGLPLSRIKNLIGGRTSVTKRDDACLSEYFELSEGYWLRLQETYDEIEVECKIEEGLANISVADIAKINHAYTVVISPGKQSQKVVSSKRRARFRWTEDDLSDDLAADVPMRYASLTA